MTTDNFCFYLQNRLIQTSQTGGQWYSDTSSLVFPELTYLSTNIAFLSQGATSGQGRLSHCRYQAQIFWRNFVNVDFS